MNAPLAGAILVAMRHTLTAVTATMLLVTAAFAQTDKRTARERFTLAPDAPKQLQSVIDAQDDPALRKAAIAESAARMKAIQQTIVKLPPGNVNREKLQAAQADLIKERTRTSDLKVGKLVLWPEFRTTDVVVGTAGLWRDRDGGPAKIIQVIDAASAIVEIRGERGALVMAEDGGEVHQQFLIEKTDTTGWIDGRDWPNAKLPIVFTGTRTLPTAIGGSKTILVATHPTLDQIIYKPAK